MFEQSQFFTTPKHDKHRLHLHLIIITGKFIIWLGKSPHLHCFFWNVCGKIQIRAFNPMEWVCLLAKEQLQPHTVESNAGSGHAHIGDCGSRKIHITLFDFHEWQYRSSRSNHKQNLVPEVNTPFRCLNMQGTSSCRGCSNECDSGVCTVVAFELGTFGSIASWHWTPNFMINAT